MAITSKQCHHLHWTRKTKQRQLIAPKMQRHKIKQDLTSAVRGWENGCAESVRHELVAKALDPLFDQFVMSCHRLHGILAPIRLKNQLFCIEYGRFWGFGGIFWRVWNFDFFGQHGLTILLDLTHVVTRQSRHYLGLHGADHLSHLKYRFCSQLSLSYSNAIF